MSTRYVWERFNRLATYSLSEREALIGIIASINPLSVSKQGTGFVGSNGTDGPHLKMEDYEDKYFEDKEQYTVPAGRFLVMNGQILPLFILFYMLKLIAL